MTAMGYDDHIKKMAEAFVALNCRSEGEGRNYDQYRQARDADLIPVLKSFYAFYQRDLHQEIDALRAGTAVNDERKPPDAAH